MVLEGFKFFSVLHVAYLLGWLALWCIVPFFGRHLRPAHRIEVGIGLAWITIAQEVVDYLNRLSVRELSLIVDLPLQFCHLAQIFSVILLFVESPLLFEITYFWGLVGALQAMLTPDIQAFDSHLSLFLFFMHHGILILIILWLIFVNGARCRPGAVLRVFLLTNLIMLPVAGIDWIIDANYMYLRASPVSDSPFVEGAWPWYLIRIEAIGLVLMALLQIPMRFARAP